jgi:hypothetical protein
MSWHQAYGYNNRGYSDKKSCDELFESLMEYENKNIADIESANDFKGFIRDLENSARGERQKRQFKSTPFQEAMARAWRRMRGEMPEGKEKKIREVARGNAYIGKGAYESAKKANAVAVAPDGRTIYKSVVVVFRDKEGHIIRDDKLKKYLKERYIKEPNTFKVRRR